MVFLNSVSIQRVCTENGCAGSDGVKSGSLMTTVSPKIGRFTVNVLP